MTLENTSRRDFIIKGTVLGGGLMLGIGVLPENALAQAGVQYDPNTPTTAGDAEVNAWVSIKPDDTVYIRIARSEMGQGTRTGLAQLVTEELECNWKKVKTQSATPGQSLARKRVWGEHGTGGSRGIRISEDYVRRGAAAARIMLLQAAANQWNVPVAELTVDKGVITHVPSGRKTTYGKVAELASTLTPPDPKSIVLRDPRKWKVAGQPYARIDTANKVNGSKVYGADLQMPGMLCASVKSCPVFGGKLVSYDEAKILGMRGVKGVVRINDSTVAVVADTWWRANTALNALPIIWDEGKAVYRPTVHYAYCPSDAAIASMRELQANNWEFPTRERIMNNEIIDGEDRLGVLLMGHPLTAWWTGSLLSIHDARKLVPNQSATTLQVAASVYACTKWMIDNPGAGLCVPDDLPWDEVLDIAYPYLGEFHSGAADWTPLKNRVDLFAKWDDTEVDSDPWQFNNFLI